MLAQTEEETGGNFEYSRFTGELDNPQEMFWEITAEICNKEEKGPDTLFPSNSTTWTADSLSHTYKSILSNVLDNRMTLQLSTLLAMAFSAGIGVVLNIHVNGDDQSVPCDPQPDDCDERPITYLVLFILGMCLFLYGYDAFKTKQMCDGESTDRITPTISRQHFLSKLLKWPENSRLLDSLQISEEEKEGLTQQGKKFRHELSLFNPKEFLDTLLCKC